MEQPALILVNALAQARQLVQRPVSALALFLLGLATTVQVIVVQPAEESLQTAAQSLAQRNVPSGVVRTGGASPGTPAEKLGAFYAFFERDLRFSDWLARFYDIADRAGVEVHQAEYRRADAAGEGLARYEIAIPVTGDYGKIRSFAEGVLNNIPVASLDQVAFRRQRADQTRVEADLRFTIHLRATPR